MIDLYLELRWQSWSSSTRELRFEESWIQYRAV